MTPVGIDALAVYTPGYAVARLFAQGAVRPDEIGMLLVGTETAVDHARRVGIFLHELLGLPPACRTVELKHARAPVPDTADDDGRAGAVRFGGVRDGRRVYARQAVPS